MKKGKYQAESQKNQKPVIILLTVAVVLLVTKNKMSAEK